jgi:hypothetical protein
MSHSKTKNHYMKLIVHQPASMSRVYYMQYGVIKLVDIFFIIYGAHISIMITFLLSDSGID